MSDRRTFLRRAAGAGALAALADARALFALESRVSPTSSTGRVQPEALRDSYLLDPDLLYMNHASIGTVPEAVHRAHARYLEVCEGNPWLHVWGGAWEEAREEVRGKGARVLGCRPEEVALTHNTTEAFNLLAQGLPLETGDEVLFSSLNHAGASVCWGHHAPLRGYRVRRFDFPVRDVPGLSGDEVVEIHMREVGDRTRVLVVPHLDNIVGLRHPLRRLARAARDRGVEFVAVDGAQTGGMIPLELAGSGVDFYATSPHKWVQAPKGTGLLYVRPEVLDQVRPMWVTSGQERWAGTVRVLEDYGTRNLPALLGLGDAADFQARVDPGVREARHRETHARLRDAVESDPGLAWRSPARWERGGALVLVERRGEPSGDLAVRLWEDHGAVVRAFRTQGLDGIRISPNIHTTDGEIDRFLGLLAGP